MDIKVSFIDTASGNVLGYGSYPADSLPENFENVDSINMGENGEWRIDKAEPMTVAEFKATGELSLYISKIAS